MRESERKRAAVDGGLEGLRSGTHKSRPWHAPLYRSRRIAVETAVRAAINFILIAALFVMAGWPSTELCLSLVAVIIGLGSTVPDQRSFARSAVLAMPVACVLAGILKYLVFNGVSEFQLLAIGLAPVIIGLALLISLPNPVLSSLGRLVLVFTLAILAPTNPQSYDPETFLVSCLFACLSAVLVFAAQLLLAPLSNERRVRLLLREARHELKRTTSAQTRRLAREDVAFRAAARVGQIVTAAGTSASGDRSVAEAVHGFDRAVIRRWCTDELDSLEIPFGEAVHAGRTALASRNGPAMRAAAEQLRRAAGQTGLSADAAVAALALASVAFGCPQPATGSSQEIQP
jgi:uncharacterized membrane protein YccC